jgi:hypothetical protein
MRQSKQSVTKSMQSIVEVVDDDLDRDLAGSLLPGKGLFSSQVPTDKSKPKTRYRTFDDM